MSNGGRWSSATADTRKTMAPGSWQTSHHGDQAAAMPDSDSDPAARQTLATASTIGSS